MKIMFSKTCLNYILRFVLILKWFVKSLVNFTKLALEGASRPSSKLIVNMFSFCTS